MPGVINRKFMELAIKEARKNLKKGALGGPFGACITRGRQLLAVERNKVLASDATSHAEINAIREASRRIKNFDLSGCTIYSTTEPCPMCFSAIHWARIKTIVYGTSIRDAKKIGFNELSITNTGMKKIGKSRIKIYAGFMAGECRALFSDWDRLEDKKLY